MPSSWLSAEVTDDPWREAFVGTHDPWHPLLALSPLAQAACHWPPTVPPSPPEAPSQPPLQIRSAAIKHPSELSARVPPTLPDGAPIALLISLAVASYQYTEQEGGSGSHAPLICSMAALSLAVLWIASLSTAHAALGTAPGGALPSRASGPGAFVRCRLPYAWASFVAAAPLLFLICDVALPLEQTQSRLDKLPARMPVRVEHSPSLAKASESVLLPPSLLSCLHFPNECGRVLLHSASSPRACSLPHSCACSSSRSSAGCMPRCPFAVAMPSSRSVR